jgi:F-type H+-transporting ATPase subunit epsilon
MSLALEVLVPDGVVVNTRVRRLQAADPSGRFGIWTGHEAFLTLLAPCVLFYMEESGREHYVAVDGGVCLVENHQVSIVTREAVLADRLEDVADAAAAMLEARRSQEKAAQTEFAQLQISLLTELRQVERNL